jgi:hypothetical protein
MTLNQGTFGYAFRIAGPAMPYVLEIEMRRKSSIVKQLAGTTMAQGSFGYALQKAL